jgi:hypothetical protein
VYFRCLVIKILTLFVECLDAHGFLMLVAEFPLSRN